MVGVKMHLNKSDGRLSLAMISNAEASFYLSTPREIRERTGRIDPGEAVDRIDPYFILSFNRHRYGKLDLHLAGLRSAYPTKFRVTSPIQRIDFDAGLIQTLNSLYKLGTPLDGEPTEEMVAGIVRIFTE